MIDNLINVAQFVTFVVISYWFHIFIIVYMTYVIGATFIARTYAKNYAKYPPSWIDEDNYFQAIYHISILETLWANMKFLDMNWLLEDRWIKIKKEKFNGI